METVVPSLEDVEAQIWADVLDAGDPLGIYNAP